MNKQDFLHKFYTPRRASVVEDYPLPKAGIPAAVLFSLIERDELCVLFTQRSSQLKHHAGQISFPGGKAESEDQNLFATATREAQEEVGLDPSFVQLVGQLPQYRTFTGFTVTPVLGFVSANASFEADGGEVAEIFEVPLAYLMDQRNHIAYPFSRKNFSATVYFIPWQDKFIWGATAAFIRNLSLQLQ